jgi:glutathione S-transferase
LERLLLAHAGELAVGDALSAADVFLYPQVCKARELGVVIDGYPTLARIEEQLRSVPAFVETSPDSLATS